MSPSPALTEKWVPLWPLGGASLGELAYAEFAGPNLSVTATSEATAQTVVTAPAVTLDGVTPIVVDFFASHAAPPASANGVLLVTLFDGSTPVGMLGYFQGQTSGQEYIPIKLARRLTPSAGAHTYSVRAHMSGTGAGVIGAGAGGAPGAAVPAFIRISTAAPISTAPAGALLPVQYGTSLPGSPVDGQEAILVDSLTAPTYQWRFRYNAGSSSAYKWEYIGGTPKTLVYNAGGAVMNNAAFNTASGWYWWATGGVPASVFPIPRAGDYIVRAQMWAVAGGVANLFNLLPAAVTATPAISGPSPAGGGAQASCPAGEAVTISTSGRLNGLSIGFSAGLAWSASNIGNGSIQDVSVEVIPARVS